VIAYFIDIVNSGYLRKVSPSLCRIATNSLIAD